MQFLSMQHHGKSLCRLANAPQRPSYTASQAFSERSGGRKASKKDSLPILKSKRHQKRFVSKPGGPLFKLARLAGFEPTACRLGEANSVRICLPLSALERFILLDF
jgi:hypothetical protein